MRPGAPPTARASPTRASRSTRRNRFSNSSQTHKSSGVGDMRKTTLLTGLFVWLGTVCFSASIGAQTPRRAAAGASAPTADGAELFAMTCQVCHGQAGLGGVGPALRGAKFTTPFVRKTLIEGRPGTMMPGFSSTLPPRDITEIAGYVVK